MNRAVHSIVGLSAAAAAIALAGCSSDQPEPASSPEPTQAAATPSTSPAETPKAAKAKNDATKAVAKGGYIDYAQYQADEADYEESDVVLFFNATWCPTCQEAVSNLESASFPAGLTVVSVDYDSSADLKREYGVTTQHTFVQVDPDGGQLAKFSGSTTLDEIRSQLA